MEKELAVSEKGNVDNQIDTSNAITPSSHLKNPKLTIWKNVLIISTGFLGLFGSLSGIVHIQSSVNKQLGVTSLWVIYISLVISCAFLPTLMIKKYGEKWTMSLCMLGYTPYIMAQLYPRYYTLIPAALIMGLVAAPMWSAKCTYLTQGLQTEDSIRKCPQ